MDSELLQELSKLNHKIDLLGKSLNSTWLDLHGAAGYLHISTSKLRKMISAGEIPFKRVGANGKLIFNRKQIDLWLIYGKQKGFSKTERQRAEVFV